MSVPFGILMGRRISMRPHVRWAIAFFLLTHSILGSTSDESSTTHRPSWLIGTWRGNPHQLVLEEDGSYVLFFNATLSGSAHKFLGRTAGPSSWTAEPVPARPGWFQLHGMKVAYELRHGLEKDKLLLLDPLTGAEVPFYRLSGESADEVKKAQKLLYDVQHGNVSGPERVEMAAQALRILRGIPEPCPVLTAQAAFLLGQRLAAVGRNKEALPFFDTSIDVREAAHESPHIDLTRACFFGGRCAEALSGHSGALWYSSRAITNQAAVLARLEHRVGMDPSLLRASRKETSAVYLQGAQLLGNTGHPAGVPLFAAAIQLALEAEDQTMATMATRLLFNHLLARPGINDHSQLLFWAASLIDGSESGPSVARSRLSGRIHLEIRVAEELWRMTPPHPDLARRVALRAIALSRIAGVSKPAYLQKQMIPRLIEELDLGETVSTLSLPPDGFWPLDAPTMERARLDQSLDAVVEPVDMAEAFPEWDLKGSHPPLGDPRIADVIDALPGMLPSMEQMAGRATAEERQAAVESWLAAETR